MTFDFPVVFYVLLYTVPGFLFLLLKISVTKKIIVQDIIVSLLPVMNVVAFSTAFIYVVHDIYSRYKSFELINLDDFTMNRTKENKKVEVKAHKAHKAHKPHKPKKIPEPKIEDL